MEDQKHRSKVDGASVFDDDLYAVSLLNMGAKLGGHSVIVVEGLRRTEAMFPELFVGQYDIRAEALPGQPDGSLANVKGYITAVIVRETNEYAKTDRYDVEERYRNATSSTWIVPRLEVLKMIADIKTRSVEIKALYDAGRYDELPHYQKFGSRAAKNDHNSAATPAENCTTWCINELKIAGVEIDEPRLNKLFAKPEKNAKVAAGGSLSGVLKK